MRSLSLQGATSVEASLDEGLAMYDLKEAQIHTEPATDTQVLLAWKR